MATQDEASDLKRRARRRLVGAIALVLFLVLVPPLVMDLEPQAISTNLKVEIPQQEGSPPLVLPTEPPAEAPAPPPEAPPPAVSEAPPPAEAAVKEAEAKRIEAEVKRVDTETKKVEALAKPEATYIIAVATLSKKENVKKLQAKASKAGIKTYTEPIKTAAGEQTRVRAGPFPSKDTAEKARAKLQQMGETPGPVIAK